MSRIRRLTLASLVGLFVVAPVAAQPKERIYDEGKHKQGELKYSSGVPILIVAGTPAAMGEQAAALTIKPVKHLVTLVDRFKKEFGVEAIWPLLAPLGRGMVRQFPEHHREEFEAFVKQSGVDRDLGIIAQIFADARYVGGCSTFVALSKRSATGGPLFGRNTDLPSLGILDKYVLVTVYRAPGKRAFAAIGYPGMLGADLGINDAGLAITTNDVYSSKDEAPMFDPRGVPSGFLYRRVLEECASVDEATQLIRAARRASPTIMTLCDPKQAAVLEITTKNVVRRRPTDGVIASTNHFRSEELATPRYTPCPRYAIFEKVMGQPKFTLADVHKQLDAVSQKSFTIQTMVFEPAALRLHLAFGATPSSALPLRAIDLGPLFGRAPTER